MKKKLLVIVLVAFSIMLTACKKDLNFDKFSEMDLNPEFGLPLFISSLSIENLVKSDTVYTKVDPDGLIRFKYFEDSIFGFKIGNYLDFPVQAPSQVINKLGVLPVPESSVITSKTLGSLKDGFSASNKNAIEAIAGSNAIFPAINDANSNPIDLPEHQGFANVTVQAGFIKISLTNTLAVKINSITLNVYSQNPANVLIGNLQLSNINPNETKVDSFPFVSKTIQSKWAYSIPNINLAGSNPNQVFVSLNSSLNLQFSLSSAIAIAGQSKFPSATLQSSNSYIFISGEDSTQRLRKIEFKSGKIKYLASSAVREPIEITMSFPGSTVNGVQVTPKKITIPYTGIGITQGSIDISNIKFDLTTKPGQNYSNIYYTYSAKLTSSNTILPFDSANTFTIQLYTDETELSYAEGFFGAKEMFKDSIELGFDFLKDIAGGLTLDNPIVKFYTKNSLGIPIQLDLVMNGENDKGEKASLGLAPFEIAFPTIAQKGQMVAGTKLVDKTTSTIDKLIALPPHKMKFKLAALGEQGYNNSSNHFITADGYTKIGFEMDLPLQIRANNFVLSDTAEADLTGASFPFDEGVMLIKTTNGFPFDATITLRFLNGSNMEVLKIENVKVLNSGQVNANGRVINPGVAIAQVSLSKTQLNQLKLAKKIITSTALTTTNGGSTAVGVYSDYDLQIGFSVKAKLGNQ
jgi:hypothetical protein